MWGLGNRWAEVRSVAMASYLTVMHEIHVLVVDHDSEGLINTVNLLQMCHYRVTLVELASVAISMLSSGKAKFDIVMANINSPDLHGFKLLQQAVNMDLPIILMSVEDNSLMAMRAIESGAFLFIKKPVTMEIIRCLWQHVLMKEKENTRTMIQSERDRTIEGANYNVRGVEIRDFGRRVEENPNYMNGGSNNMIMTDTIGKSKKNIREENGEIENDEEYGFDNHNVIFHHRIKRKVCTEWTRELHDKFMDAVQQLGEGRCFPKEIVEIMNVPGLTRMQVASHLQKCRNDNWRSPEERKSHVAIQSFTPNTNGPQYRQRRFGSMPLLAKAPPYHVQVTGSEGGEGSKTHLEIETPNGAGGLDQNPPTGPIITVSHQQQYGSVALYPSNVTPVVRTNPRNTPDDFFSFPEMDSLIQKYAYNMHQGSGMNHYSSSGGHHVNPPAYHGQNSAMPSVDTRSQWNSDASNVGNGDEGTRGNY